jgi:hypothetical protein
MRGDFHNAAPEFCDRGENSALDFSSSLDFNQLFVPIYYPRPSRSSSLAAREARRRRLGPGLVHLAAAVDGRRKHSA